MGVAYFIVLNSPDPGFDTIVDGKALARHAPQIDSIAAKLGFKSLDEYCSQSPEDARVMMADLMELEDEVGLPTDAEEALSSMPPEEWHDSEHGMEYAQQILNYIRRNPTVVDDAEAVLFDLETMTAVLARAKERGLKWHFQIDF